LQNKNSQNHQELPQSLFRKEGRKWTRTAKTGNVDVPLFAKEGVGGVRGLSSKHILIILFLALAARVWYVSDVRVFPFFTTPVGDEAAYHSTAQRILNGDLLAGKRIYYQDPFYPYFLAAIYKIADVDILAPKYVQMFLGIISVLLIALIAESCFGPAAGVIAGVAGALYPLFYFFEAQLLKSSLVVLFTLLLFWLLLRYYDKRENKLLFFAGCAAGLGCVSQGHTYFFVPVIYFWLAQISDLKFQITTKRCTLFTAGALLMILPFTLRNLAVAHELVLTTYQAGTNFYMGNHANADGVYESLRPGRDLPPFEEIDAVEIAQKISGRKLKAAEVSAFWFSQSFKYISTDPAGWLKLLARKARIYANYVEVPDVIDYSFVRGHSFLLRLPLLNFGFIFPLGLLGMLVVARGKNEKAKLLLYGAIVSAVSVIAFYIFSRYRLQSVPFYLILSVQGCLALWAWYKARRKGLLAVACAGLIALLVFSNYNMHAFSPGLGEGLLGSIAISQKQFPQAIKYYEKVLELNPDNIALRVSTNRTLAQCHFEMGNYERVVVLIDLALAGFASNPKSLDPEAYFAMLYMQAKALERVKETERARNILQSMISRFPGRLEPHIALGTLYKRTGQDGEAEKQFTYILNIDTMNVIALNNLANILRDRGEFAKAEQRYRQSLQIAPGNPVILKNIEKLRQMSKGKYGGL
jgi:tetratricopeptide (TPR) repeat protein